MPAFEEMIWLQRVKAMLSCTLVPSLSRVCRKSSRVSCMMKSPTSSMSTLMSGLVGDAFIRVRSVGSSASLMQSWLVYM